MTQGRIIRTAGDLDGLPIGTVLEPLEHVAVWQRIAARPEAWACVGRYSYGTPPLPARVVSQPQPASAEPLPGRQTVRRYAHELYPHAEEGAPVRPLVQEVPYRYAMALGLDVWGTGWSDADPSAIGTRVQDMIDARRVAFLLDGLATGLEGDAAWRWAEERTREESGEWVWERAAVYGVDPDRIKPYPIGPQPQTHDHYSERNAQGSRRVIVAPGPEELCEECTEEIPAPPGNQTLEGLEP